MTMTMKYEVGACVWLYEYD